MNQLWILSGDPDGVRALAGVLEGAAARLQGLGAVARGLTHGAVWDGPAGEAFAGRLAEVTPVLQRLEHRYVGAARELRLLAPELDRAQQVANGAVTRADDADEQVAAIEEQIVATMATGAEWDSAQVWALRRAQQAQLARLAEAEADHARAVAAFEDADARCAAALRQVAEDDIADPGGYRLLHLARTIGTEISSVDALLALPPGKALLRRVPAVGAVTTAAGWMALASEVGLMVVYDEGSWGDLASGAAAWGLGFAGKSLKRGATSGSVVTVEGKYVKVIDFTKAQRVRNGVKLEAARRWEDLGDTFRVKPANPPFAGAGIRGVDTGFVAGWRLSKASGATRMYAAGVTLELAPKVADKVVDHIGNQGGSKDINKGNDKADDKAKGAERVP